MQIILSLKSKFHIKDDFLSKLNKYFKIKCNKTSIGYRKIHNYFEILLQSNLLMIKRYIFVVLILKLANFRFSKAVTGVH